MNTFVHHLTLICQCILDDIFLFTRLIKSSFRKQGGVFSNKYNVESGEGIIEEPEEREVDLLRMRLGTHLMLERVNVRDSDADGDVIAGMYLSVLVL